MKAQFKYVENTDPDKLKTFYPDNEEPEAIHVIKTGHKDTFIVVHEDAWDLTTGNSDVVNSRKLEDKYGIKWDG